MVSDTSITAPTDASRRKLRLGEGLLNITALLIALLIAIPVIVVAAFVFVPAYDVWAHLAATVLPGYLINTLILMVTVSALVLGIGVTTAWFVTMYDFPGRKLFSWALFLPLAMPAYIIAYTYTGMFDFAGPVQTFLRELFGWGRTDYWFPQVRSVGGAGLMLGLVLYPYVFLVSRASFTEQSIAALEVGRTLGRSPFMVFWQIALPLARPAIVAGLALALMETLSDFGTVQYFAVDTFTTGIYRTWLGLGEPAAAAQLAAILMLFILSLLALERYSRGRRKYHHTGGRYQEIRRQRLRGISAIAASAGCFLPVFMGFLLPVGWLVNKSLLYPETVLNSEFPKLVLSSVGVAGSASLLALVIALFLVFVIGRNIKGQGNVLRKASLRISSMGYAIPGPVLAVGS
ncbi:ABC transporter permease [Sneathiella glossodoripedis]|uniref:ABC transporter permease n=1 Tax=Sneathiella glossodoripedis TaxID=418853 RepID=UPI001900F854|nr:iron ABC transporter permease [Sneathiella glossodoripedis]